MSGVICGVVYGLGWHLVRARVFRLLWVLSRFRSIPVWAGFGLFLAGILEKVWWGRPRDLCLTSLVGGDGGNLPIGYA